MAPHPTPPHKGEGVRRSAAGFRCLAPTAGARARLPFAARQRPIAQSAPAPESAPQRAPPGGGAPARRLLRCSALVDAINARFGALADWRVLLAILISAGNALIRY